MRPRYYQPFNQIEKNLKEKWIKNHFSINDECTLKYLCLLVSIKNILKEL